MFAHADETDDSHAASLTHPGCAIVPAALAMAERYARSGSELLRAVVLGYDIGTRFSLALGAGRFADCYHLSSHAYGGAFGATAAACALARLNAQQTAHALSYAVQMASGNRCWLRDPDHVQKAFVFGGMPASSGVQAALMAAAGFTGVADALEGTPGFFASFSEELDMLRAGELLGEHFAVMQTSLKKWSVGSPVQAALDAIDSLVRDDNIALRDIARITVTLPAQRARVVDSAMPNINLRHVLALYLKDSGVSFAALHDHKRMLDPAVLEIAARISVEARAGAERHELAELTLITTDGRRLRRAPKHVRGQPDNPMSVDEVLHKARALMLPVLGGVRSDTLLERLLHADSIDDIAAVRELWQA
jgi:2-methylcitrate dehydratase PrpD